MKDNKGMLILLVIVAVVIGAVLLLRQPKTIEIPVDIGTDFPAEVQGNVCQSREGVEMGLCCAIWDQQNEKLKWVLCEDLVLDTYPQQAFFNFETGDTLQNIAGILYAIRLTNEGNFDSVVKISSITAAIKTGGDSYGVTEIQTKMASLVGIEKPALKNSGFAEYGMTTDKVIRLDIPSGADMFEMADGTYSITINIMAKNEAGVWINAGSRTVDMTVEQEVVSFAIAVTSTAQ